MEMPDRVYAKLEMLFLRNTILTFARNRRELGQNGPHQANDSKPWEHQKQNCGQSDFFYLCTDGQVHPVDSGFTRWLKASKDAIYLQRFGVSITLQTV